MMKTSLPLSKTILQSLLIIIMTAFGTLAQAQELQFKNVSSTVTGSAAGTDGAIYRFPNVTSGVDALVKINGRSSSLVQLVDIDVTSTGFDKAFQPQVTYNNGSVGSGSKNWWMEFQVTFVQANTSLPVTVSNFDLTALDIDGDDGNLREYVSLYNQASYTLENNSVLGVSSILESILSILTTVGKQFTGSQTDYSGIVTTATQVMTTNKYINKNTFRIRTGATTTGSSSRTERNYSMWFKSFAYNAPVQTSLPVKMYSFAANLNNSKVDLKWVTASEINVSHFVVEKSTDGVNFSDAGLVFAYGNATDKTSYTLSDNVNTSTNAVIYYRLRSIDNDGKSELSETRIIRIGKQAISNVSIVTYPNPVSNEVRITIPANWQSKKVLYEIFNSNGVVTKRIESANSSQTEAINVSSMAPGFYIVKVSFDGQVAQQKIVKQ